MVYSSVETNEQGYLCRFRDGIVILNNRPDKDKEQLLEINIDENFNFKLKFNNYDFDENGVVKTQNSAWFALIKNRMDDKADVNRYELKEGDIIRIGRLFLRLKFLKLQRYEKTINNKLDTSINGNINNKNITTTNENTNTNLNNVSINTEINLQEINVNSPIYRKRTKIKFSNFKPQNSASIKEEKKEIFCRICYGEENEEDNPLVQPCNCHGSMKYVHLKCLKQWLKINTCVLQENDELLKIFKVKKAECELCKTELPDFIRHKGKLYEIIDFGDEFKNYAIFENLIDNKHNKKYLYMISLDNNNTNLFTIGRGHDCNLVLNDASISRNHCALRFFNKKLFLEDLNSKFGTLILIYPQYMKLVEGLKLYLQIGRSFLNCEVQKSFSLFGCCNISETKNFDFYYKQNKIKIEDMQKMTVKTEMDFDTESNISEDKKKIQMIDESCDDINSIVNNQKLNGEEHLITNLDINIKSSPIKLNAISECIDENINEVNNYSANNANKVEIYEERKNN